MKLEMEGEWTRRRPRKSDYYDWGEVFICLDKLENKAKRGRGMIDNR